ncbi:hypothetical protein BDN67DRAFT_1017246 [Paxillus ammoniavirescens]|nr:hypothetical protein BDN67DRAFT_1017246 [Paxillus ammoniavirescens]
MDLKLSELEHLLHYVSVRLMTIHEQSTWPEKGPLDPIPELYALFWLEELHVARWVVTLMAVQGLPHALPGPLQALSPQFIAAEMDGQAGRIAVMKGMMADDCEDLIEDKRSGLPWQDAWWQPGVPPLVSDYASRPMEHFSQVAAMHCGMVSHKIQ